MNPRIDANLRIRRHVAVAALSLLCITGFLLRIWNYRYGLPAVLHSDAAQVGLAVDLLTSDNCNNRSPYPPTGAFGYDSAFFVTFCARKISGAGDGQCWTDYLLQLQTDTALTHGIIRIYTALLGALLPIAVYRIARIRYSRKVSLLAAAIAAFCPASVLYSHQARIHVPAVTILTFLARPVLRLAGSPADFRRVALAGAACGAAFAYIQLGLFLCACAVVFFIVNNIKLRRERPWVWARRLATLILSGLSAWGAFYCIWRILNITNPVSDSDPGSVLGIPVTSVDLSLTRTFLDMGLRWVLAEPARALFLGVFIYLAIRDRARRFELYLYGLYPLFIFSVLGLNFSELRYSLSATPFLACIAASAAFAAPSRMLTFIFAAILCFFPLAASIQYNRILGREDSREVLARVLPKLVSDDRGATVQDSLVICAREPMPFTQLFPFRGDFRPWYRGQETPAESFNKITTAIFVRSINTNKLYEIPEDVLLKKNYKKCCLIKVGYAAEECLPDAPAYLFTTLLFAKRPGPTIEIWARSEPAVQFLKNFSDPNVSILLK